MARMSGNETIANSAKSESRSIRTTIPVFVVDQLGIKEGVHLTWKVDKTKDDKWIAIMAEKD